MTGLYWLVWGAALLYVGTGPEVGRGHLAWTVLFFAVTVASGLALAATLKWTAEFANHIAAIDVASRKLGLNTPKPVEDKSRLERFMSLGGYLPYEEFTGAMALPLPAPIWLTVGPVMAMVQVLGLFVAVALVVMNGIAVVTKEDDAPLGDIDVFLGLIAGSAAVVAAVLVSWVVVQHTKDVINRRIGS